MERHVFCCTAATCNPALLTQRIRRETRADRGRCRGTRFPVPPIRSGDLPVDLGDGLHYRDCVCSEFPFDAGSARRLVDRELLGAEHGSRLREHRDDQFCSTRHGFHLSLGLSGLVQQSHGRYCDGQGIVVQRAGPACGGVFCSFLLQFLPAISSPSGAVSTLIGLVSFAGPALSSRHGRWT